MGLKPAAHDAATTATPDPIHALILRGDHHAALDACAREHGPVIGRVCMAWLGAQAEAEEAAQEVLLAAFDAMPGFRAEGTVRAWLFTIARRVCARRAAMRVRREARLRLIRSDEPEPAPAADALFSARARARRLHEALESLRPSDHDAVILRFEGELSFREIAAACDIDEAAARKRVSRALARLREALGNDDDDE